VHCTRSDVDWSIVASRAVRRLLSICDPDGELPLAEDLDEALPRLDCAAQIGVSGEDIRTSPYHARLGRGTDTIH
jgi:hypothetical protein